MVSCLTFLWRKPCLILFWRINVLIIRWKCQPWGIWRVSWRLRSLMNWGTPSSGRHFLSDPTWTQRMSVSSRLQQTYWFLLLDVNCFIRWGISLWFRVNSSSFIVWVLTVRLFVWTGSMIAHKFRITNPQDYGLYLLVNGEGWSDHISHISFNVQVIMIFC